MTMANDATHIVNNNDVEPLVEPMDLESKFYEVSWKDLEGTDDNGPESVKFFNHGIELQFRVDDSVAVDDKIGEMIGRTINEMHKLPKIKADQISFFNYENKGWGSQGIFSVENRQQNSWSNYDCIVDPHSHCVL